MASRSILKSTISVGVAFNIPVKVYTATVEKHVAFNNLHATCRSRLQQKRWCPVDKREVFPHEIVRAYEYSSDEYIEVSDADLETLPVPSKHVIQIASFVGDNELDRVYVEDTYWLDPEPAAQKPYELLRRGLRKRHAAAVGTVVLRNKEVMALLRASDKAIIMETLYWPDEVRLDEIPARPDVLFRDEELGLMDTVIRRLSEPFNPAAFRDTYREALLSLIQSKADKSPLQAPPAQMVERPATGDLMAALQATVADLADKGNAAEPAPVEVAAAEPPAKPRKRSRKAA